MRCALGSGLVLVSGAECVRVGSSRNDHSGVSVALLNTLIIHDVLGKVLTRETKLA